MPFSAGARLGPYEILSLLGKGGMGEVYRARDPRLGRDVAIKVLPPEFVRDPERLARFEREARVLASLNHQNIAAIYGFEQADGVPFLVLEFVPGETLRGPLPPEEAVAIARQVADALESAHEKDFVHRDLKPANIKVTPEGKVKVLDFGLAKALADEAPGGDPSRSPTLSLAPTRAGTLLGTAAYMSPEQARGRPLDKRADIWAFGCVLYELLSGRQAFGGESITDILAAVVRAEPDWSALPAGVPPNVRWLLGRCLEKDPARRLRDIADAWVEMQQTAAAAQVVAPPPRRRGTMLALAGFVAGVVAAGSLAAWLATRPVAPPAAVRFLLPAPQQGSFESGPLVSPDGRLVAFVASTSARTTALWVRPLDSVEARALPGTEDAANPFWSPDSRSLGYFTLRRLMRVDVTGGSPQSICDGNLGQAGTWSVNGVIAFSSGGAARTGLYRVNASGGRFEAFTKPDASRGEVRHGRPYFLPGGRELLYSTVGAQPGINVVSVESGAGRPLAAGLAGSLFVPAAAGQSTGYLLGARDRRLWAQPFDPKRLQALGEPILMAEQVGSFSASNTGVLAHWTGGGTADRQLYWFDRSGKRTPIVGGASHFELSPDGRRIAFDRRDAVSGSQDVWVLDLSRGTSSRLTFDRANETTPAWSPDGSKIVFSRLGGGRAEIYQILASGAGRETLLAGPLDAANHKHWSPDGRFLAFDALRSAVANDIWVLPIKPDGSAGKPEPFLNREFTEAQPQFSPDTKWLAYISDETGRLEVYVQSFPDKRGKWQISSAGGAQPRWRRDGRELYYLAFDRKMMVVEVKAGPAGLEAAVPRALFETPVRGDDTTSHYEASSDGQRFLMPVLGSESQPEPATVVVHWTTGLKK